jgi:glycosyltransferase involved in cell wall biosynthesis
MTPLGERPLVSIVTPVYNCAQYLEELIRSILDQDYKHVEHIVIDDGSTDGGATVAILARYPHLRWWSRENRGQYQTQNEGLAAARGDIVGVIAADDKYVTPSALSAVIAHWRRNPELDCVYGRTVRIDGAGTVLPADPVYNRAFPAWQLRYFLPLPHCSLFVSRDLLMRNRILFDPSFRHAGDWDWIMRLSIAGRLGFVDTPLSMYREHPAQTTMKSVWQRIALENRRVRRTYNANPLVYWAFLYYRRASKVLRVLGTQGPGALRDVARLWISRW